MDDDVTTGTVENDSLPATIPSANGTPHPRHQLNVRRTGIILRPNNSRVVIRPFEPASENRIERILGRVAALSEAEVDLLLDDVLREFRNRHQKTRQFFLTRFEQIRRHLLTDQPLSENRKLLMGAYFTQEYSLESAALFNPSMIWHPDQSGLPDGSRRFILSLRATGEGHISSITFRVGVIDGQNQIHIDEPTRFVTAPELVPNTLYDKRLFAASSSSWASTARSPTRCWRPWAISSLTRTSALDPASTAAEPAPAPRARAGRPHMLVLAQANYEICFGPELNLSERIIFPSSPTETNGIEDARFVAFTMKTARVRYYATYTAFDGKVALPQILETEDFLRFKASTLNGPEVRNKGLALFPRKVNGLYAMLSRQDNENIYLMYSDMLHFWYTKEQIASPPTAGSSCSLATAARPWKPRPAGWS